MSQNKVQATRTIHFSQMYGSMQLILECNRGDLYQNYINNADGTVTVSPDYYANGQPVTNSPRVKPILVASSGTGLSLGTVTWKIGTVTLNFNMDATGQYKPCTTSGYTATFMLDSTSKELVVIGNLVNALNKQSTVLNCETSVLENGVDITTLKSAIPVTIREVNANGYDIHIVPAQGSTLGIMQNSNPKLHYCKLTATVAQGATQLALSGLSNKGISIQWQMFVASTGAWTDIALGTAYDTTATPSRVGVPKPSVANDWEEIVVPSGAVDSQLLVRANLILTTGSGSTAKKEVLATDTATIYDNTDELIISPNPDRDEEFVLGGTAEQSSAITYTPKVMQGDNDVTVSGGFTFSYQLLGSAGEVMNPAVTGTGTSFTVTPEQMKHAAGDVILLITATAAPAA